MRIGYTPNVAVEKCVAEILPREILNLPKRLSTETSSQYLIKHFFETSERVCVLVTLRTSIFVEPGFVRILLGSVFRSVFGIKVCHNAGLRF